MDTVAKHEKSFDIKGFLAFQGSGGADLLSAFRLCPAPFLCFRACYMSVVHLWLSRSTMNFRLCLAKKQPLRVVAVNTRLHGDGPFCVSGQAVRLQQVDQIVAAFLDSIRQRL